MKTYDSLTFSDFLKLKETLGGDLWNKYKFAAIAFSNSPADTVEIRFVLGTGLWCDITAVSAQGDEKEIRIYDHTSYLSKKEILEKKGVTQ